ncbi:hypothetical protein [Methylobacterium sp. W2]|uniref:Acb2/Tad1 domain-containing protein n=1 Tax=Methylobacterium sp. W2 TaxID=2598107 RepID=UPI001D0CC88F|nr:hypothetical protein [Methylobacterium sp. W2]
MDKFTKKPVTIEAFQWTAGPDQLDDPIWICDAIRAGIVEFENRGLPDVAMLINTTEGLMTARLGDWIIRGVEGELYPCKDSVFQATYAPAGEAQGLPVAGYRPQSAGNIALGNANKAIEEQVLRVLDGLAARPEIDKPWLAIGRTDIEKGFMAVNRAVFQPCRVTLPDDAAEPPRVPRLGAQDTRSRGEPRP